MKKINYMCGIAGKIYFKNKKVSVGDLNLMSEKIAHRGPDDKGIYISYNKNVGLVNRRLAVIDLSEKGHQPMSYDKRYWITTNSEIYNYKEEKNKLEKAGYFFNSDCDTEVILALYKMYGVDCLKHLRGMFAFCIYDEHNQTLFLARDRIGVKPLKYFLNDDVLIFASELKAILTQKEVKTKIDNFSIYSYLTYGYVPSPYTGFENIKKLEPGHYIYINLKKKIFINKKYWQPIFKNKLHLSEMAWCQKILSTLEDSTKIRLISDVPLGCSLSGGVDSSGVVACMSQFSTKPVKTFTIIFKDKNLSEAKYAKNIARRYHTEHYELKAEPTSVEILPQLAYQYEEPFADASNVVTYMVSKLAKKYVTVLLNGDGGDENFAGYPNRYFRLKRDVDYIKWITTIRPFAIKALRGLSKVYSNNKIDRSLKFLEKSKLPLYRKFASYSQIYTPEEIQSLATGDLAAYNFSENIYKPVQECFELFKGRDLKDAGLKFDLLHFLPDQLLAKVDIAGFAVSLESRSPFLDYKMIELANRIPFNLKVKNGESKYILKKALEKIVPKVNLYRPKVGFTIPLDKWFAGKINKYAFSILLSRYSKVRNFFDMNIVRNMVKSNNRNEDFGPRIWSLLSLELWLRSYFPQ